MFTNIPPEFKASHHLSLDTCLLIIDTVKGSPVFSHPPIMTNTYYVGVDVGTSSVRAALVLQSGDILRIHSVPITVSNPKPDFYEQDSEEIWQAVCESVKTVTGDIANKAEIHGVGFDATCSLVVLDKDLKPVTVSPATGEDRFNVVMWMDHRAKEQADFINSYDHKFTSNQLVTTTKLALLTNLLLAIWSLHFFGTASQTSVSSSSTASYRKTLASLPNIKLITISTWHFIDASGRIFCVLKYVGGKVSLEMQTPKLLWLKRHMKSTWARAAHFLDLPDFLTLKASGQFTRSLCSMVCKWTYICDGQNQGWDHNFFKAIGLEDLADDNSLRIGKVVMAPGTQCGRVSKAAALQMGLTENTYVATSIIDAHAGGLALVAAKAKSKEDFIGRLGLICGTSTCHMCVSMDSIFVPGVWGPYYSAMIPGFWLTEGGQSATGALIDHLIKTHPAASKCPDKNIYDWLGEILADMAEEQSLSNPAFLTKDLHLYPDFHGNRSPLADPSMVGMICGLTLDLSERSLAVLYLASVQALAYGTRHIIEQLMTSGHTISSVLMCGGLSNSSIFIHTHADALGVPVLIPQVKQSVLLGASMLAAAASGDYPDLSAAAVAMGGEAHTYKPQKDMKRYHDKKYAVFKKMQNDQKDYRHIMSA
ncbi:FGGY carbohydrate kinase domain-containing protein isoform X2 [Panulirus ornatus]|uniref:FGGY carbohydrate kinase domain-containing protein isoform X2 n=1 Tax=Panulirus ornatus TaxID=150431 RepID=UPI003A88D08A